MLSTQDNWIRELCQGIADVDYVIGEDISKRTLVSEQQYLDLEHLFAFNDAEKSRGREPYVKIITDDKGINYALLSRDCVRYALSQGSSLVSEKMITRSKSDTIDSSLKTTNSEITEGIIQKPKGIEDIPIIKYSEFPKSYKMIGDTFYAHLTGSDEDLFLSFIDIAGGYLN